MDFLKNKKIVVSILGALALITALILGLVLKSGYLKNKLELEIGEEVKAELFLKEGVEVKEVTFVSDLENLDLETPGEVDLEIKIISNNDKKTVEKTKLVLVDTTSPEVKLKEVSIGRDVDVKPELFIEEAKDNTKLKHEFVNPIDMGKNEQDVEIISTDLGGNSVTNKTKLTLLDIKSKVTKELGSQHELNASDILYEQDSDIEIEIITSIEELQAMGLGEHEVKIKVDGEDAILILEIVDTIAPEAILKDSPVLYIGYEVTAEALIADYKDKSKVKTSFKDGKVPEVNKVGKFTTIIVLTDEAGNTTEVEVPYEVKKDDEAPSIIGAMDITIGLNQDLKSKLNVAIDDNVDKNPKLTIDDSKVNLKKEGKYPVTYIAKDKVGNENKKTITVTVSSEVKEKKVQKLGDKKTNSVNVYTPLGDTGNVALNNATDRILSNIINDSMSNSQKSSAIYAFMSSIRYRTGSVTNGYATDALNTLSARTGNCFGMTHTAQALYTRAGIPNRTRIQKDRTHSWLQVNIGNGWQNIDLSHRRYLYSDAALQNFFTRIGKNYGDITGSDKVSKAIARYIEDGSRKELAPTVEKEGNVGSPYSFERLTFPGYKLKYDARNAKGEFNTDTTYVTFVYEKDSSQSQVNKDKLQAAIKNAEARLNTNGLSQSYIDNLNSLLKQAKNVYKSYNYKQAEVDNITETLVKLTSSYELKADTRSLERTINSAKAYLRSSKYTTSSLNRLRSAVNNAESKLNSSLSNYDIEVLEQAINSAINSLVEERPVETPKETEKEMPKETEKETVKETPKETAKETAKEVVDKVEDESSQSKPANSEDNN